MKNKPTIGFLIVHGPEIRTFAYSGLINALEKDFHIVIWSSFPNSKVFEPIDDIVDIVEFPQTREHSLIEKYSLFVYNLHLRWMKNNGFNKWQYAYNLSNTNGTGIKNLILDCFANQKIITVLSLIEKILQKMFLPKEWVQEIIGKDISILVCGNYFGPQVNQAINAANHLKKATYVILHSWKDSFVHPRLPQELTGIFLWSENDLHQFKKWNPWIKYPLLVTGSLHIKALLNNVFLSKKQFYNLIGVDLGSQIICYTMASPVAVPNESQIITILSDWLIEEYPNVRLLVRLNPMDNGSNDNLDKKINIIVQKPNWEWIKSKNWCAPFQDDGKVWASTIFYSSFNISIPSTVSHEFVTMNRPVINIAFDGEDPITRFWNADFYEAMRKSNLVFGAFSLEELKILIRSLLNDCNKMDEITNDQDHSVENISRTISDRD